MRRGIVWFVPNGTSRKWPGVSTPGGQGTVTASRRTLKSVHVLRRASHFHCVFTARKNIEKFITRSLQQRLWPFLGGIARENQMKALMMEEWRITLIVTFIACHDAIRRRHAAHQRRIIKMDATRTFPNSGTLLGKRSMAHSVLVCRSQSGSKPTVKIRLNTTDQDFSSGVRGLAHPAWPPVPTNAPLGLNRPSLRDVELLADPFPALKRRAICRLFPAGTNTSSRSSRALDHWSPKWHSGFARPSLRIVQ